MISIKHNLDFTTIYDKFEWIKNKPTTVSDYNNNMAGIDRANQISYYPISRKCLHCGTLKFFFYCMLVE